MSDKDNVIKFPEKIQANMYYSHECSGLISCPQFLVTTDGEVECASCGESIGVVVEPYMGDTTDE